MPAVVYPTSLSAPSKWAGKSFERRAVSSLPGNTQLRNRSRDAIHDIDATWIYTSEEMEVWTAWYNTSLLHGMLWFTITVPGPGGWIERVARFRTKSLRKEYLGNGVYNVSAQLQQRGISAPPWYSADPDYAGFTTAGEAADNTGDLSSTEPGLADLIEPGDHIYVVIFHQNVSPTVTLAGFTSQSSTTDSSGVGRMRWFVRVADGTSADYNLAFGNTGAIDGYCFGVAVVKNVNEPTLPGAFSNMEEEPPGFNISMGTAENRLNLVATYTISTGCPPYNNGPYGDFTQDPAWDELEHIYSAFLESGVVCIHIAFGLAITTATTTSQPFPNPTWIGNVGGGGTGQAMYCVRVP